MHRGNLDLVACTPCSEKYQHTHPQEQEACRSGAAALPHTQWLGSAFATGSQRLQNACGLGTRHAHKRGLQALAPCNNSVPSMQPNRWQANVPLNQFSTLACCPLRRSICPTAVKLAHWQTYGREPHIFPAGNLAVSVYPSSTWHVLKFEENLAHDHPQFHLAGQLIVLCTMPGIKPLRASCMLGADEISCLSAEQSHKAQAVALHAMTL